MDLSPPSVATMRKAMGSCRTVHFSPVLLLAGVAASVIGTLALLLIDEANLGESSALHGATAVGVLVLGLVALLPGSARPAAGGINPASGETIAGLIHDKEVAETANAAKSRYLASVSHEIRSPLNAIYGYAQLVEREDGVNPKEAARVIRRSAEHLTSLIEGLLDISQIESGVLRIKQDVVRLSTFLDQLVWMMRPGAEAKGLEFRCILPERLPEFVRMDQNRLRQVLINLLSNAIKFTDHGNVTFRLRYAGQIAVFEIVDTGPGIAPEDHARIFAPYERGAAANQPGIGLGLPIARAIVEILGGKLEMDSTPGEGSRFAVTMMLGQVTGTAQDVPVARRVIGYDGGRRSILVVDDDVRQLSFMKSLLEALGFDVAAVPDGETAVRLSKSQSFDLAILDITLPGISGWETSLALRETLGDGLGIIMLSANSQEFHRPDFNAPVHDLFLVKPVEFDALISAMGGLLNLAWQREAVPETPPPDRADPPADRPLSVLPTAALPHVERLRELLRIGHVRGIEAEIRLLAAAAPDAQALVASLFDSLDRFDLSAMARRLEGI